MNRNSNTYTLIYVSILVILVAVGLSFTHQTLKERQTKNVNIDKMQQILRSLRINESPKTAETAYNEIIKNAYLINQDGTKIEDSEGIAATAPAFDTDIAKEGYAGLPVFEAEMNGEKKYIIPIVGKGLWGALWGYLSINADGSEIYGADFSHAGETPGLGAEIAHDEFSHQFQGKNLFRSGIFTSIAVVKHGQTSNRGDYVDGISGGTITSHGVDHMLYDTVEKYKNFLLNLSSNQ